MAANELQSKKPHPFAFILQICIVCKRRKGIVAEILDKFLLFERVLLLFLHC